MRERPIIFNGAMVRAIQAGQKTQTRRVVHPQPREDVSIGGTRGLVVNGQVTDAAGWVAWNRCRYGVRGDRLWVRETSAAIELPDGQDGVRYAADGAFVPIADTEEAACDWIDMHAYRLGKGLTVPAIHMPRWASRITPELEAVRIERLQEISEADALYEGVEGTPGGELRNYIDPNRDCLTPRASFRTLWDSINGGSDRAWEANCWVWVLQFRRV